MTRLPLRPAITASAAELIVTQELVRRYSVEAIEVGDQLEAIRLVVASGRSGSSVHDPDHVRVPGGIRNGPQ